MHYNVIVYMDKLLGFPTAQLFFTQVWVNNGKVDIYQAKTIKWQA